MQIDKKILECEIEYSKCFSKTYEDEEIIRFSDEQLKDMYYHNFLYVKDAMNDVALKGIIEKEISSRRSEESTYCNILLSTVVSSSLLSLLEDNPEISMNGYYSFDSSQVSRLNALSGCEIKKVFSKEMVDDVLFCDLQYDEVNLGKDFCTRRCYRRGKVYISDYGVDSYVCYHNGKIIGTCNLFIHNGVAEIEDFVVIPTYQCRGYGTTILKELINIALQEKVHTIYLVADEEDTPKEMYIKLGFSKIGERTDLLFKL